MYGIRIAPGPAGPKQGIENSFNLACVSGRPCSDVTSIKRAYTSAHVLHCVVCRCILNETHDVQSARTSAEPPRAAVNCEDANPSRHYAHRLRRLANRRDHPAKAFFEGLYDWRSGEGGAGGGGLFEMPPPAKGTSKGPPNPTVWVWEGRSGAHRPRSGGTQGRSTSSQTLARVEPREQARRRPRLRPPVRGTTSTATQPR
jgi:hypothetical protein